MRIQPLHPGHPGAGRRLFQPRKEKTLEYLDRYRALRPDFAGVDYIMAWNFVNFKMYREAEDSLVEALRKDAAFIEARLPLAGIYAREGKVQRGLEPVLPRPGLRPQPPHRRKNDESAGG